MAAKKVAKKKAAKSNGSFKLTYATMFNPPEVMHTNFDKAVAKFRAEMGKDVPMLINGEDRFTEAKFDDRSPINTDWLLGTFQKGGVEEGKAALAAARAAVPKWANLKWKDRVKILRKAAAQIEKRLYEIGAVVAMEIGKNRMEALGDVQETADLISYYCDQMELNNGYIKPMGKDPLVGYNATNVSVLKPYGVWVVISPFNFPFALAGGPSGAALVAGNTVVFKPASDTPYSGRLLAECFRDAGVPSGVFNYVTGGGSTIGQELISNPEVDGITFTGSYDVGMHIYKTFATGKHRAVHRRDGRQESRHRHGQGRSRRRRAGHHAIGVRSARSEVLGLLARVRRERCEGSVRREAVGSHQQDRDRRSDAARELAWPGGEQELVSRLRQLQRGIVAGRRDSHGRQAPARRRSRQRLFLRANARVFAD